MVKLIMATMIFFFKVEKYNYSTSSKFGVMARESWVPWQYLPRLTQFYK